MKTTLMGIMECNYWMILLIVGAAYGSPYYYREDKHHSEHHKEYSYGDGHETSPVSAAESSPQKYYDSSYFSSHVTPERYHKLDTSPSSYSSGFSKYSGGQSSSYRSGYHSSGAQSSGFQSGVISYPSSGYQSSRIQTTGLDQSSLIPLASSSGYQSSGFQSGVISLPSSGYQSSGFQSGVISLPSSGYQSSGIQSTDFQSGHLIPLASGKSINVEGMKPGTYVIKQVKVYRQPPVYTSQTGFYGSSSHNSQLGGSEVETGQKEESLYGGQHEESLNEGVGQVIRQHLQTTSLHHQVPQVIKTISTQEKKLYGQEQINDEDFPTDSHVGQQTEDVVGQKEEGLYNQHMEDFGQQQERGDLEIGQVQENLNTADLGKTILTSPANDGQRGYKYYEKRIITYGTPVENSNAYKQTFTRHGSAVGNFDGPTTTKTPTSYESKLSGSSLHREYTSHNQEAVESGKTLIPIYSSQPSNGNSNPLSKYTGSLEVGQQEENSYVQKSQDFGQQSEDLGQQLETDSLEIGQRPVDDGQKIEIGSFEIGQKEDNTNQQHAHSWQRQVNISRLEVSGQRTEPIQGSLRQPTRNTGLLQTGNLEIEHQQTSYSKPQVLVKENITRTLIVGHNLPTKPSLSKVKNDDFFEGQREETSFGKNVETGFLENGQREENLGQLEMSNLETGQHEETLAIGQQLDNFGQLPEKGDLLFGQKEDCLHGQLTESDNLELGQREESTIDLHQSALPMKLIGRPTMGPTQSKITPYINTYNRHESHYNEFKQTEGIVPKKFPSYQPKYDTTPAPISTNQEFINKNQRTNYFELQRKAEELALLLGSEDSTKERSSQQEKDLFHEEKLKSKQRETTTETYAAEIQELGLSNTKLTDLKKGIIVPKKQITTWEARKEEYGLNYPSPSQTSSFSSKKHSKHYEEKQTYSSQPMTANYGFQEGSQRLTHYGGYQQGGLIDSKEKSFISDQPIQRTHTSGSQFSFSSSGGDKNKAIDDFLSELDKDIARTNYQERQQQGSYSQASPGAISRSGSSGTSYYAEKTVSHSSSSHSSTGTAPGGDKSWYRRIGDSIGSSYNQAKDKAKEIVKTVKQSVGYSNS